VALAGSACAGEQAIDKATSNERVTSSEASELEWGKCPDSDPALDMSAVECATLDVPVDHADPDGPTIELVVGRVPASSANNGSQERVGQLLTNPGGPGESGIDSLAGLSTTLPEAVLGSFDLISWDPRGVARSAPVRCLSDERNDAQIEGDLSPDTPEEMEQAIKLAAEYREACEAKNPEIIQNMSTADVAADMEAIRLALGGEKLNYLGFSYGTAIGATYATMFGENVRAMVLDGAVSPDPDGTEVDIQQLEGFQLAYDNFVKACAGDPECALGADPEPQINAVRQRLDLEPVKASTASGERTLGRDLFDVGMATALYDPTTWGMLARAIANLDDGGAELMLALSDIQTGREADGSWNNSGDAQSMVNCADSAERPDLKTALAEFEEAKPKFAAASPTFGETLGIGSIGCVDWPVARNPVPDFKASGAPPIMVVGTLGDPATPYEWAEQMTQALESAFLVTYEGEGHTGTTRGGECMSSILTDYLLDPAAEDGLTCPPVQETDEAGSSPFAGVEDLLIDELVTQGAPEKVARCVAEGMVEHYGETRLELSLIQPDLEDQMGMVTNLTMQCMAGG
jgi:pimeloyl-ACP methyl ester carboxylesterase